MACGGSVWVGVAVIRLQNLNCYLEFMSLVVLLRENQRPFGRIQLRNVSAPRLGGLNRAVTGGVAETDRVDCVWKPVVWAARKPLGAIAKAQLSEET